MVSVQRHSKKSHKKINHWKAVPVEAPILTTITTVLVVLIFTGAYTSYVPLDFIAGKLILKKLILAVLLLHVGEAFAIYFIAVKKKLTEDDQAIWALQALFIGLPACWVFMNVTQLKRSVPVKQCFN